MPYVSRDGRLVFVPADASLVSDRVDVARASVGSKRSIAMLGELGKGPSLQEPMPRGGGGSSLLDRAAVALDDRDADVHAALPRAAGGGEIA